MKLKKTLLAFIAAGLLCFVLIGLINPVAYADAAVEERAETEQTVEPRGLYVNLSIALSGGNGEIIATAKNEFTLFPSTVAVIVELYSSVSYQESYLNMTLENRNSITDLDMGKSLVTSASTNGVQRWWVARLRYRKDSSDWQEKVTNVCLCDGDGNFLGI